MRTKKAGRVSRATATLALAAATVLGGTLLTAVPAQAQQQEASVQQTTFCPYRVVVDVANVRSGAGTNYSVVRHLYRGNEILATSGVTNSFRQIKAGEWIASSNLTRTSGSCLTT